MRVSGDQFKKITFLQYNAASGIAHDAALRIKVSSKGGEKLCQSIQRERLQSLQE